MLSSRDMTPSLVVGTSRISAGICTYIITNLHITTALFDVFATTSPPSCIYRQHFSPLAPPFRRRPAYTDSTFRCFQPYFNADLHIPTYTIFIDRQTYVSRGMRISGHTSPNIRISGHTYLGTYVSPDIRISGQTYLGAYVSKHTYLGAYVSRDIRISGHAYLGADVSRDIRLQTYVSRDIRIPKHAYLGAYVSRGIRLQTYVSRGIRISGHTYLQTCVSRGRRICRHTYLRAYVSRGIRISKHTYLGTSVRIVAPMILCHISRAFGSHPYRYPTFMDIRDLEESWRASQHSVTSLAIQVRHPACR